MGRRRKTEAAACWRVEVVKGRGGERTTRRGSKSCTAHEFGALLIWARNACALSREEYFSESASLERKEVSPVMFNERRIEMVKNVSGLNRTRFSSRATTSPRAGLCTRPALSPNAMHFHNIGDMPKPVKRSIIRLTSCART